MQLPRIAYKRLDVYAHAQNKYIRCHHNYTMRQHLWRPPSTSFRQTSSIIITFFLFWLLFRLLILLRLLLPRRLLQRTLPYRVRLLRIDVGKQDLKHIRVPINRLAFDAFSDVLSQQLATDFESRDGLDSPQAAQPNHSNSPSGK